jgi:hypothetical protein
MGQARRDLADPELAAIKETGNRASTSEPDEEIDQQSA